ncbi:hypothetical protein GGU10DRAFT_354878 [Lentinula aff. detonsa]|uniref:Uncharacterized protein n=1 Tax=Lentinula aff. detonsa TaxID=2804958 RepID=A0AA38NJC7_9AGAR|nr:hypothetical protein GGU10DRAFT_354878 [Lentinula aff. detonsa]
MRKEVKDKDEKYERENKHQTPSPSPPFPSPPPPSSPLRDLTSHILQTLTTTAQYAPTPYLGPLCVVALSIFEAVQGAKENQEALTQLAGMVGGLVFAVRDTYLELELGGEGELGMGNGARGSMGRANSLDSSTPLNKSSPTPSPPSRSLSLPDLQARQARKHQQSSSDSDPNHQVLNTHVKQLLETLQTIHTWIHTHKSRKYYQKLISSKSDLLIIQDFRDQLGVALGRFEIQSLIAIRGAVEGMRRRQEGMERDAAMRYDLVREKLCRIEEDVRGNTPKSAPNLFPVPTLSMNPNNPFSFLLSHSPTSTPSTSPFTPSTISIYNISGNHSIVTNTDNSKRENYGNVYNYGKGRSGFHRNGRKNNRGIPRIEKGYSNFENGIGRDWGGYDSYGYGYEYGYEHEY